MNYNAVIRSHISITFCPQFVAMMSLFSKMFFQLLFFAGETNLSGKFDIVRIDLHPSEQYKSVSKLLDKL